MGEEGDVPPLHAPRTHAVTSLYNSAGDLLVHFIIAE